MVIVEYCKYGNLRDFLLKQRDNFISQIDEVTGQLDFSITDLNKYVIKISFSLYKS